MRRKVFYSWQSDIRPAAACRTLIQDALEGAARRIAQDDSVAVEPVVDRDTEGIPGSPDIGATILAKIEEAAAFVGDVTIVNDASAARPTPNPNVLIELGFALKALGADRVILVQNTAFGPPEALPFDLRQRRVTRYSSPADAPERAIARQGLQVLLERALRQILMVPDAHADDLALAPEFPDNELYVLQGSEPPGSPPHKAYAAWRVWVYSPAFALGSLEPAFEDELIATVKTHFAEDQDVAIASRTSSSVKLTRGDCASFHRAWARWTTGFVGMAATLADLGSPSYSLADVALDLTRFLQAVGALGSSRGPAVIRFGFDPWQLAIDLAPSDPRAVRLGSRLAGIQDIRRPRLQQTREFQCDLRCNLTELRSATQALVSSVLAMVVREFHEARVDSEVLAASILTVIQAHASARDR